MGKKLNLGSGATPKLGYVNIDLLAPVCDLRLDLEVDALPFQDDEAEEILAENLFAMIGDVNHLLNECHRVLAAGGTLEMLNFDAGKHPSLFFQDPEHRKGFTRETYNYFVKGTDEYKNFGEIYGYEPWKLISVEEEGACLRVRLTPIKE